MRRLLLVLLVTGCGATSSELDGSLDVTRSEYGSWSMVPTRCSSGEHQGFFGVDLIDGDDTSSLVRLVLDPIDGYSLVMNVPGEDLSLAIAAPAASCEMFDLLVERQSSRVNDIQNVRGHILVRCDVADIELDADLQFSNCH